MMNVPIQTQPNQAFTIILDNNNWDFTLKTVGDSTVISIILNGVDILDSVRAVAGSFVIPSKYEESGNFIFTTANFDMPYYSQFNITQSLIYISAAELVAIRTPPALPITSSDFNPLAALPLRFSPQGYVNAG